jgi:hypothetical protein
VLARERTVAVEANPRAISQMPNVSSNNPPGMAPTSPASGDASTWRVKQKAVRARSVRQSVT